MGTYTSVAHCLLELLGQKEIEQINNLSQCLVHAILPINVSCQSLVTKLLLIEPVLCARLYAACTISFKLHAFPVSEG